MGVGVEVGVDVGDDPAVLVVQLICEPPEFPSEWDPVPVLGLEVGVEVGVDFGVVVVVLVVVVVEVVEVFEDPPLIDGLTLMIGWTLITGALFTAATALARAPAWRRCRIRSRP